MTEKRLNVQDYIDPVRNITYKIRTVSGPVKLHFHEFYELEIVLDGNGNQNLNGISFDLQEGSVYFLTPVDFHALTPHRSLRVMNIAFDGCLIPPELQLKLMQKDSNLLYCSKESANYLCSLCTRILNAKNDGFTQSEIRAFIELILIEVLRQKNKAAKPELPNPMQDAMVYLYQNFQKTISLSDLASITGYTPSYFSKLFAQKCGMGFHSFLEQLRVNYAKQLLISTTDSINDIGEKSGFPSLSGFYRIFHSRTGKSPGSYRTEYSIR